MSGETPEIVVLGPGDTDALWPVYAAVMSDPWSPAGLRAALGSPEARAWGARSASGGWLGFAVARRVLDEIHLDAIGTRAEVRRAGIARALLDHVRARARAEGLARVLLEVRADNAPALALYEALDFMVDGRRPRYYPDGEAAVLMSLLL